jgi:lysophospholipase
MAEAVGDSKRTGHLAAPDGARVFFRAWTRPGARGRILCVHGLGEHSGRYGNLADAIGQIGLELWALDMRGHGRSDGRRGHVGSLDDLLGDLDRLRGRAEGHGPDGPTWVLGHSLGGLVVGRWLLSVGSAGVRGAIFVAPFVDVALEVPNWKRRLGAVADRLAPNVTLPNGLPLADLFRREEDRRVYDEDPLVHRRISARLWGEMGRGARRLGGAADGIGVPALFQLAGEDRIVSNAATRKLASELGPRAKVLEYDGAYHALYHDPRAAEAFADLRAWLGERRDDEDTERESTAMHTGRQA